MPTCRQRDPTPLSAAAWVPAQQETSMRAWLVPRDDPGGVGEDRQGAPDESFGDHRPCELPCFHANLGHAPEPAQ